LCVDCLAAFTVNRSRLITLRPENTPSVRSGGVVHASALLRGGSWRRHGYRCWCGGVRGCVGDGGSEKQAKARYQNSQGSG